MNTENRKGKTGSGLARIFVVLGLGLWLAGCAGPNALEADYGRAVANNIAQQVVNPGAGYAAGPPVGLSPKAAENQMESYDKSFKAEEKKGMELKMLSPGGS